MNAFNVAYGDLRIVVVEDDDTLRDDVLVPRMRQYGFALVPMRTAAELQASLLEAPPDIVVLDVGLPDADGFALARSLRESWPTMGVVMLTGRGETADRIRGLTEGADAYLSKPVDLALFAATLHSVARRVQPMRFGPRAPAWRLDADGWCLVSPAGASIALSKTERRLLQLLMDKPGRMIVRDAIFRHLSSDPDDFDPHRLDSLIHRLRRKVQKASAEDFPLTCVHGEGYVVLA
ncbi:MAG: response regulator transcription factor [Lysobacter sp.]|nr:response regulator transcription factor [Lysobacter sp.]